METARTKLTKSYIDKVPTPPIGTFDKIHWDTELKGFGLKVTPKVRANDRQILNFRASEGKAAVYTTARMGYRYAKLRRFGVD
jgi:hypothetical protein